MQDSVATMLLVVAEKTTTWNGVGELVQELRHERDGLTHGSALRRARATRRSTSRIAASFAPGGAQPLEAKSSSQSASTSASVSTRVMPAADRPR